MFWQQISHGNGRTALALVLALMLSFGMAFQSGTSFYASASVSQLVENDGTKPEAATIGQIHIEFISIGQKVDFQDQSVSDFGKTHAAHCQNTSCPFVATTFIQYGFIARHAGTCPIINSMMRAKTDAAPPFSPPRRTS